jgi:hypothetical protein
VFGAAQAKAMVTLLRPSLAMSYLQHVATPPYSTGASR